MATVGRHGVGADDHLAMAGGRHGVALAGGRHGVGVEHLALAPPVAGLEGTTCAKLIAQRPRDLPSRRRASETETEKNK